MDENFQKEKKLTRSLVKLFFISFYLFLPPITSAETPANLEEKKQAGLNLARKVYQTSRNYQDTVVDVEMILKSKSGESAKRELQIKQLEVPSGGAKSLVIFQSPPDVKGTTLLSFSYPEKDDDQWLYLPALARVKRISSNNQNGPFMASEFAYEDMSSQELAKFDYLLLKNEKLEGQNFLVLEKRAKGENSGYSKQIVWVEESRSLPFKIEYYDKKETLLKILQISGYKEYDKKHWRPEKMVMENQQTGKSTELNWKNYHFKKGLTDQDFNQDALKKNK